jgi:hypothetical protein
MDANKLGLVVGLLFVGFAFAAFAAGFAIDNWTETASVSQSRSGY